MGRDWVRGPLAREARGRVREAPERDDRRLADVAAALK